MGSNESLENLLRSGVLKAEPPDRKECEGLMRSALDRLKDARTCTLSFSSRFDLAYNAAHALALTALRLSGYRSDKRYLVFQCLIHTTQSSRFRCDCLRCATSGAISPNMKAIWMKMTRFLSNCWRAPRNCWVTFNNA